MISMSNTIYLYNLEYFLSKKQEIDIDINLKNLFNKIFNNYDCFNDNAIVKKNYHKQQRYKFNNNNNNKRNNYFKSKNNNFKETNENDRLKKRTDIQIILGYLNKLSKKTYNDLSTKIVDNIYEENYKKIIDKLFEISYKQSSYCELYIQLYKKIINIDDKKLIIKISDYLLSKIISIINNDNNDLTLIEKHINKIDLEYDDFCDINKNAKYLKGKINIICNLIKNNIIDLDEKYLINNLFKYKNYKNEIFLELIQILNNILKLDDDKIEILQNYVNTTNFKGKMMLKFKLKDIIDNKPIKDF